MRSIGPCNLSIAPHRIWNTVRAHPQKPIKTPPAPNRPCATVVGWGYVNGASPRSWVRVEPKKKESLLTRPRNTESMFSLFTCRWLSVQFSSVGQGVSTRLQGEFQLHKLTPIQTQREYGKPKTDTGTRAPPAEEGTLKRGVRVPGVVHWNSKMEWNGIRDP